MELTPSTPGKFNVGGHFTAPAIPSPNPNASWRLNHSMLRIRDPAKSLDFYMTAFGMRVVFTFNAGPFTIYFLGYPKTPEHSADLSLFAQETVATIGEWSLLELVHVHGSENEENNPPTGKSFYENGNDAPHMGFGHIGFTVPNVEEALKQLSAKGIEIIKHPGTATREEAGLTTWEEQRGIGKGELHPDYQYIFKQIGFVRDPDGYLVEVVPSQFS